MTRLFRITICVLLIVMLIVIPCISAKKEDNPVDTSKFKLEYPIGTMDAYEILSNGGIGNKLNNNHPNMNLDKTVHFEVTNGSITKIKKVYVYRKSTVILSNDSETIMQSSKFKNSPTLELYYGYDKGLLQPWKYYYRVDDCDVICRVVHADYYNRTVWITYANETTVNAIADSEQIPIYEVLP